MPQAVIFDFDGVIVLNDTPRFVALQRACASNGLYLEDTTFPQMVGRTARAFFADIFPGPDDQEKVIKSLEEYDRNYKQHIEDYIQPIDWVVDFVKNYSGNIPLAIASASTRDLVEKNLNYLGIAEKFSVIITQNEIKELKPSPRVYQEVLQVLGIEDGEAFAIEDTHLGVQAAVAAGIPCYALLNGVNAESDFNNSQVAGFIKNREELERLFT